MKPNLRNELASAIMILGGIALAIGVILLLSSANLPTDTITPTAVADLPVDEQPTATVVLTSITAQNIIVTDTPMPTTTPRLTDTPMPTINLLSVGCENPSIQITSPRPNDRLTEPFEVIGTAALPNFGAYRIEIRADSALVYQRVIAVQQVVYADILAEINPTQYPSGIYWIRLVVIDNRGNIPPNGTCAIPTIFE